MGEQCLQSSFLFQHWKKHYEDTYLSSPHVSVITGNILITIIRYDLLVTIFSASFQQCFHESLSAIRHNSDNHHNYLAPTKSVMCEIEANVSPFLFFSITEHGSFSHQARIRKTDLLQFNIKFFKILFTPYGLGEGGKSSPLT